MAAYYNEIDEYAAAWLRNLIAAGHIAPGDVDTRSITEVRPDDLRGYTQAHFFAGIGGWSKALRLAGWDDDRPVWTGSCPCQPYSAAGKQDGHADERHLWPYWGRLAIERRPPTIFGEQVAVAITFGWLDSVFNDLEKASYACAATVLPACSVGLPHRRDRVWFVANAAGARPHASAYAGIYRAEEGAGARDVEPERFGSLGLTERQGLEGYAWHGAGRRIRTDTAGSAGEADTVWVTCDDGKERPVKSGIRLLADGVPSRMGRLRAYGNAIVPQVAAEFIKASGGLNAYST